MGTSVQAERGRRTNFDLNLVPFIDLLSVQITFLLATAVWLEISSLPVDQAVSSGGAVSVIQPLVLRLQASGVDWGGIRTQIDRDRAARPDARDVVLHAEDGVPYEVFIRALDLTRDEGYDKPAISGD